MATGAGLKRIICRSLVMGGVDRFFRLVNREKLMVVMYHGVTRQHYDPPIWTQLPVGIFRSQLEFIKNNYTIIRLEQLLDSIRGRAALPQRAALLTFDDGLKNNYSVAFPLLKEFDAPATIFLTSDFIGTSKIFWFDELYLLLSQLRRQGAVITVSELIPDYDLPELSDGEYPYATLANWMKLLPESRRQEIMSSLRQRIPLDPALCREDFLPLGWDEVRYMQASGLVDFGTHTANHRILAKLGKEDLCYEVAGSKVTLEQHLGRPVFSFCYPNGLPGVDFTREHEDFLSENGYLCAFSTQNGLNSCDEDLFAIKRILIGNDGTSEPDNFRLNTSGALDMVRKFYFAKS